MFIESELNENAPCRKPQFSRPGIADSPDYFAGFHLTAVSAKLLRFSPPRDLARRNSAIGATGLCPVAFASRGGFGACESDQGACAPAIAASCPLGAGSPAL